MFEDLLYAFRTFRRNKTRTLLSLLGVIIGVASVIIITSIGESAMGNVEKTFGSSGLNLVYIGSGFMQRSRNQVIQLNQAFKDELFAKINHIKKIWSINNLSATLSRSDNAMGASASAVDFGYLEMCGLKLDYGSYFSVSDNVEGTQVLILTKETAEALFPEGEALNKSVILTSGNEPFGFKVIGVLANQTIGVESAAFYVTRGFYSKKIQPSPEPSRLVLEATRNEYASTITEDVRALVKEKTGDEYTVQIISMQSMLDQFHEVTGTMSLLLSGIAAISLLVGGIGIMNIMIVTVTERKKEIGLRKAIGATPYAIRVQFLVESATITLLGGILGIAIGIGISAVVIFIMGWTFAVQFKACVLAFLFSAFVGVFFGFNPASRAAKLDPVEALASE